MDRSGTRSRSKVVHCIGNRVPFGTHCSLAVEAVVLHESSVLMLLVSSLYSHFSLQTPCSLLPLHFCCFSISVEREVVQKRTFTRWMNLHLEKVSQSTDQDLDQLRFN